MTHQVETSIRSLDDADLDKVSGGGGIPTGCRYDWGANSGLGGIMCGPQTYTFDDVVQVILDTVEKGRKIQQQYGGGGRPS